MANAVSSLGYVRIGMQDPQAWASVGEDVLGFAANRNEEGSVHLRMDAAPFRFVIEQAPADGFICAGWECSVAAFSVLSEKLELNDIALQTGSADAAARREVAAYLCGEDPSGNMFELYHSRTEVDSEFNANIEGVSFVAGELGMGHVVLPAAEFSETSSFYQALLGFGMSDELKLPPPAEGMPEMAVHFLHAQSPRHHSLGLFNGPAPSGVVHMMVELANLDAVGTCLDRVNAAGLPITATLGRHANDGMVSFYFLAPGGIPVEVGYDGLQFDWDDFVPTRSTVGDLWGHAYSFPEATT